jgi:hypothetical protein
MERSSFLLPNGEANLPSGRQRAFCVILHELLFGKGEAARLEAPNLFSKGALGSDGDHYPAAGSETHRI